jgi:O-antigen ligase
LQGSSFKGGPWFAPRMGMFSVAVLDAGGHADFRSIRLQRSDRQEPLANSDFAQNLAHWFPAARFYFLPWHIDNLYLELLIERGLLGLLLGGALVATALWQLVLGSARRQPLAPYLAASLSGVLLVGLVSSVMDVPRVAFLLFLLVFCALQLAQTSAPAEP